MAMSIVLGIVVYVLLPGRWAMVTRVLTAWDVVVAFYLGDHDGALARCRNPPAQDEGAFALMVLAAAAPRWAPALTFWRSPPSSCHGSSRTPSSPCTMPTSSMAKDSANGLRFPGDNRPDYWDFIYFSFVIGTTFQVSDVAVTNRWIRHSDSAHGVLSFFFNTAIFALTVNMAASMI